MPTASGLVRRTQARVQFLSQSNGMTFIRVVSRSGTYSIVAVGVASSGYLQSCLY